MVDFEARRIIEALRSGISSKAVGQYFYSARPQIMASINQSLNGVCDDKVSSGIIVSGKYGEGKTHLLNTVFNLAHSKDMVVSLISLGKESPFDKLYLIYQKIVNNTYLPNRLQPGFSHLFDNITLNSPVATEMLAYTQSNPDMNKLTYLLKAYLSTENYEEKFMLLADLEGDFMANPVLKQIYKRIYPEKAIYTANFNKSKNTGDYVSFLSHLFISLGYKGWVILFDEAELIGRLGKKARINAYKNMSLFLNSDVKSKLECTYSIFAMNASFVEDVIETKHEFDNLDSNFMDISERNSVKNVLNQMSSAPQLIPLNDDEILTIFLKLKDFHARAYNWNPQISIDEIFKVTQNKGFLLRTRIRAAVEVLDQLYQYGQTGNINLHELDTKNFEEETPSLEELL